MSGKEVLTLQFGHYSNFIGTHFWNINDLSFEYNTPQPSELNHDILYREGLTNKGYVTYTPRTLLVDLKGSLKTMPVSGTLYEDIFENSNIDLNWDENRVEVKRENKEQKNKFMEALEQDNVVDELLNRNQNLETKVSVWSDFLYTRLHSRTVSLIKKYRHEDKDKEFGVFPLGSNLWKAEEFSETFSDKIRNYIEECDNIQGFHVILDAVDAFSGLAVACIEYIQDEYDRKSILAIPTIPSYYNDYECLDEEERHKSVINDSLRVLNIVLTFNGLADHTSLFVPLCTGLTGWRQPGDKIPFYHLNYDHTLWYHTSAILASAIDTFTLKHRLRSSNFSLHDLCADLTGFGRRAAAASLCLPFSFNKDATFMECLDYWEGPLSRSITPNCEIGSERLMQYWFLRGIPEDRLKLPPKLALKQKGFPAYNCRTVEEMLTYYVDCTTYRSLNSVTTLKKGLTVKPPFPNIFDLSVDVDGNIDETPRSEYSAVQAVPVLSGLHSCSEIGSMFESLCTEAGRIKFSRFYQFRDCGFESDEFNECLEKLSKLRECYEQNYI